MPMWYPGATFIEVKKHGSGTKYMAKAKAFGHKCDLAILAIDDEEFWKDLALLELGYMPRLSQIVHIVQVRPKGEDSSATARGHYH